MFKARRKYLSPKRPDVHQAVNRATRRTGQHSYGIIPPDFLPHSGPRIMVTTGSGDDRASMAPAPHSNKNAIRRGFLSFAVFLLVLAGSMFGIAQRLDWTPGWVFLGVYVLTGAAAVAYLWRANPEVLIARSQFHWRDETPAHKALFVLLLVAFIAIIQIAALDAGRFRCSAVPLWLVVAGYMLLMLGDAGSVWVLSVNKFAEPSVSIQSDRGHKLIDTGPYAIVRHPLYAAMFFVCLGVPLAMCSYWCCSCRARLLVADRADRDGGPLAVRRTGRV